MMLLGFSLLFVGRRDVAHDVDRPESICQGLCGCFPHRPDKGFLAQLQNLVVMD